MSRKAVDREDLPRGSPLSVRKSREMCVDGRYDLLALLGRGGMADVYRARDRVLGRDVALKFLDPHYAQEEEFVERFSREAQSAASLSHPNIVQVYDRGLSEEGAHYIAMEYVLGGTLKDWIREQGALPAHAGVGVALQITEALHEAHAQGVIHRDVKPQNVLVTESGAVKVADFGLARLGERASADAATQVSRPGAILGTASYMAPELALGEQATPESDLYSLGAVLYELLTGEPPFSADGLLATHMKHVNEPLEPLVQKAPHLPPELGDLVARLLAKQPGERYESAAQLSEDLARLRAGLLPAPLGSSGVAAGIAAATDRPASRVEDVGPWGYRAPGDAAPAGMYPDAGGRGGEIGRRRKRRRLIGRAAVALSAMVLLIGLAGWSMTGNPASRFAPPDPASGTPANQASVNVPGDAPRTGTSPGATDPTGEPVEAAFVHRATSESISANSTYLDNPLANGNPEAFVSVTQNWNPEGDGGTYNDHPVGVWYDSDRGRWAIFNQDRAEMLEGASFNVTIAKGAGGA